MQRLYTWESKHKLNRLDKSKLVCYSSNVIRPAHFPSAFQSILCTLSSVLFSQLSSLIFFLASIFYLSSCDNFVQPKTHIAERKQ